MRKHLSRTAQGLVACLALTMVSLLGTRAAEAGDCCVPPPTVVRLVTVRSPECPSICTTVKVCLPACIAHTEPCVSSRPTLFGQGLVHLTWRGGPTVSVRFSNHGPKVFYR